MVTVKLIVPFAVVYSNIIDKLTFTTTRYDITAYYQRYLLTDYVYFCSSGVILISDLVSDTYGFQTFRTFGLRSYIHENFFARVQDEAITLVHRRHFRFHLFHSDILLAFDLVQLLFTSSVDFSMVKTGSHTTG